MIEPRVLSGPIRLCSPWPLPCSIFNTWRLLQRGYLTFERDANSRYFLSHPLLRPRIIFPLPLNEIQRGQRWRRRITRLALVFAFRGSFTFMKLLFGWFDYALRAFRDSLHLPPSPSLDLICIDWSGQALPITTVFLSQWFRPDPTLDRRAFARSRAHVARVRALSRWFRVRITRVNLSCKCYRSCKLQPPIVKMLV